MIQVTDTTSRRIIFPALLGAWCLLEISCEISPLGPDDEPAAEAASAAEGSPGAPEPPAAPEKPAPPSAIAPPATAPPVPPLPAPPAQPAPPEQAKKPETPAAPAASPEESPLRAEVRKVFDLVKSFQEKAGLPDLPVGDPRRQSDPEYQEMDKRRQELVKRYSGQKLAAEDHLLLCSAIFNLGEAFMLESAYHCNAYLSLVKEDPNSDDYLKAIRTAGIAYFNGREYKKAEEIFRKYLTLFCASPDKTSQARQLAGSFCRRILTDYLPDLYHRTGDLEGLEVLVDECWAHQLDQAADLKKIRQYLIEDLWKKQDLKPLEKLCKEVLKDPVWGKYASANRDLIDPALSALARFRLLQGDCLAVRRVYMDYAFENPDMEADWGRTHVNDPSRYLCQPAPALVVKAWLNGAPAVLPEGKEAAGPNSKAILLHFFEPGFENSLNQLKQVVELAPRRQDRLQVLGLIPLATRHYNAAEKITLNNLSPEKFKEATEKLAKDLAIPFPLAILEGGKNDPNARAYGIPKFPALVLIGPQGDRVAFHPLDTWDGGWEKCVEALKN
ncbi:MAG: hypothetical protein HY717_16595 [Planctomycetes bacterium]|nr:hypothetical protein [Planctomycetota bacterium]